MDSLTMWCVECGRERVSPGNGARGLACVCGSTILTSSRPFNVPRSTLALVTVNGVPYTTPVVPITPPISPQAAA